MNFTKSIATSMLYVAACSILLSACKKTTDAPPLPENRMLRFTVTNTRDGAVEGVINDSRKTITVYIPYFTALVSLLPEIAVPAGATVTPAGGTLLENWPFRMAMEEDILYTVKDKSGNATSYKLVVDGQQPAPAATEVSAAADPLVIQHRPKQQGLYITISGDNLIPNSNITFLTLVNEAGKGFQLVTPTNMPIDYKRFSAEIPADSTGLPSGKYTLRVTSFSKTVKLSHPVIIQQLTK